MSLKHVMPVIIASAVLAGSGLVLAQTYPHAYPRKGAVKLHENERVAVWEVNWLNKDPSKN